MGKPTSVNVRKTRQAAPDAVAAGRRSARGRPNPIQAIFDVNSGHPLIPRVQDPAPSLTVAQYSYQRLMSHHLYRNEPLITNVVDASGRLFIGDGPVPVSRFPELDDLWMACAPAFDNTGRRSAGAWLRQDGHRTQMLEGEFFVHRRDRFDAPEADHLDVPMEWEIHGAAFCPLDFTRVEDGLRWTAGIATVRSKPVAYKFWAEDPTEPSRVPCLLRFERDEIYHVHDPMLGHVRGMPVLASALLRAIKMTVLEDSEIKRKQVAALSSIAIERPVDAADPEDLLPSEEDVEDMIDAIKLSPGGMFELPYGYKMTAFEPKDEPGNFEKSLRWQVMMICMACGIPMNEVMGDEGVERWGRMMSQRVQRQADLVHDMYVHQLLRRQRRDFVDAAMSVGLWTPPADMKPWELYQCDWRWPVIPAARLDQELKALMDAVDRGIIPQSHVSRSLFGMAPETVARVGARDQARLQALGYQGGKEFWLPDTETAARIQSAVDAEEAAERDLADESSLEDSVLDDDAA